MGNNKRRYVTQDQTKEDANNDFFFFPGCVLVVHYIAFNNCVFYSFDTKFDIETEKPDTEIMWFFPTKHINKSSQRIFH